MRRTAASLAFLLITSLRCLAHDPYEITATIRIETNRTTAEIEMEFNTAMLLVGVPRVREPVDQAALFQSKLPELQLQAARFFDVGSGKGAMIATDTNVTLGVENHVKFNLEFPKTHSGLKLHAGAVKSLGEQGPYGVSVTVLDMVNLKVLGQSVLFANSPPVEFGPVVQMVTATNAALAQRSTNEFKQTEPDAPRNAAEKKTERSMWRIAGLMLGALVLLALAWLWQRRGGGRTG